MAINGEIMVSPVKDAAGLEDFLRLPWRLYQHDPYWVPPLLPDQRRFLDQRTGPFFEIGEAQYFLAFREGQPVGRISAHRNRLHDEHYGPATDFWGFRKAVDWVALKNPHLQDVDVPAMERRLEEILSTQKVTLANYNPRELARRAEEIFHLFNEAWSVNWGHVPLTRRQFDHLLHEVK